MPRKAYMKGDYSIPGRGVTPVSQTDLERQGLKKLSRASVQGIPNAWGPALLFSWMLSEGNPDDELKTKVANSKEVFLKLLRGLFGGILEVRQEPLDDRTKLLGIFREMSPLNGYGTIHKKILFFLWNDKTVAVGYPECILFPAAKFSDWPEYPPVNDDERALFRLIDSIFEGPQGSINEDLFLQFLDRLLKQNTGAGNVNVPWFRAIQEFILAKRPSKPGADYEELTEDHQEIDLVKSFDPATNRYEVAPFRFRRLRLIDPASIKYEKGAILTNLGSLPLEKYGIVYDEINDTTYIFNAPSIERPPLLHNLFEWKLIHKGIEIKYRDVRRQINGKIITKPEKDFFVEKVLTFSRTTAPTFPDLPIRTEFRNLVRACEKHSPNRGAVDYRLHFVGFGEIEKRYTIEAGSILQKEPNDFSPCLALWPKFNATDWQAFYAYYCCGGADKHMVFRMIAEDGTTSETSHESAVFSRKPYVGAVLLDGSSREEFGFYDLRNETSDVAERDGVVSVGIDFGTSNTCVSWKLPKPDPQIEILSIRDHSRYVFFNEDSYVPQAFFPRLEGSQGLDILPSELLMKNLDISDDQWKEGLVSYSIPTYALDKNDSVRVDGLVDNIKWHENNKYLKAYFVELFLLIFAAIRGSGYRKINLGLSYPHSFTSSKYKDHFKCILDVLDYVSGLAGIEVHGVKTMTESAVGAGAFSDIKKKKLVVDIGGGTTDIALLSEAGEVIYSDSVRFAGGDLIDVLASRGVGGEKASSKTLNHLIRLGKRPSGIGQAADAIGTHFEILYDVLRRLMAGAQGDADLPDIVTWQGEPIQICPLGQGWKFLNFTNFDNTLIMKKYFRGFTESRTIGDPKKLLALNIIGALTACPSLDTFKTGLDARNMTDRDGCGRKTIVGAGFKIYVKRGREVSPLNDISWRTTIPRSITGLNMATDNVLVQLDGIEELLVGHKDNKLGYVLRSFQDRNKLGIPELISYINLDINTRDYGYLGPGIDNIESLLVSPFVLFLEKLKDRLKETA